MARFLPLSVLSLLTLAACGGSVEAPTSTSDAGSDTSIGSDTAVRDGVASTDVITATDVVAADVVRPDTSAPDTGTRLTETCAAAGGKVCTAQRWHLCPIGYEPIGTGGGHYDCGDIDGWCCVLAPPSSCSSSGKGNCVPGGCTGCWAKVDDPSLTCEEGRGCCIDMCD
jgi:hypothetical protein